MMEVVVRPPEVFVRPLAHEEAVALKRKAKQAKHFATRERAAILLASNVGNSVPQIAAMWMTDESHVRTVIHDFNERGMVSLDPEYRGGRPRRITDEARRKAVAVAGARPDETVRRTVWGAFVGCCSWVLRSCQRAWMKACRRQRLGWHRWRLMLWVERWAAGDGATCALRRGL